MEMTVNNTQQWSTYEMPENNRKAEIWRHNMDFWVYLYEDEIKIKEQSCAGHNILYAENCAENWVHKWGQFET